MRMLLVLLLLALSCGSAVAETTPPRCVEVTGSAPISISSQGVYCLTKDLSTAISSGNAITISAPNVTLDCNDHKIGGASAGAGTLATGIRANAANVTVRNCGVRGFRIGISMNGVGSAVEDNRLDFSTYLGIYAGAQSGGLVRGNRVLDTGGNPGNDAPAGIYTVGDVDVIENIVANVSATEGSGDTAYGLRIAVNSSGAIGDNHVRGILVDGTGNGPAGIRLESAGKVSVYRNRISNPGAAPLGFGLICHFDVQTHRAIASDNHINGFSTFSGGIPFCYDGGQNVAN